MSDDLHSTGQGVFDAEMDTCGLNCPLPLLKTKKALAALSSGQVLRVYATDPGAAHDLAQFARQTGHALLSQQQDPPGRWVFDIRCR